MGKALKSLEFWEQPRVINTDKAPTYGAVLAGIKQLIKPVRGFKTMKTA